MLTYHMIDIDLNDLFRALKAIIYVLVHYLGGAFQNFNSMPNIEFSMVFLDIMRGQSCAYISSSSSENKIQFLHSVQVLSV